MRKKPVESFVMTVDGVRISIRHEKIQRKAAVIIAPGYFQSKLTRTFKGLALDIEKYFDVVSMDFRGHGRSRGFYTFSAREKQDLRAVAEYARARYEKVGVLGFSLGGSIAILEQAEYGNLDSLICVGSPMDFRKVEFKKWWHPEAWKVALKGLECGAGARFGNPFLRKVRPIDAVGLVSPTPILFIHGSKDPTVNVRHSLMLFEAARDPKDLQIFYEGSHAEEIYRQHRDEFVKVVIDWFRKTLGE